MGIDNIKTVHVTTPITITHDVTVKIIQAQVDHSMPEPAPERPLFMAMLQGNATNQLTQISTRSHEPEINPLGVATIENGNFKVFIEEYDKLTGGLRISTHKLLDACTIALTNQNNYRGKGDLETTVNISLDDYMIMCGIPQTKSSKDKTRRKIKEDLDVLYSISIEWSEPKGKQTKDFDKMRICDRVAIKRGEITINFTPDITRYLTNAYVMQYPISLLTVDERNPSTYYIGKKLLLHNSIDNNQMKNTANIISVKALLKCCPDIPKYEDISKQGRIEQRIIKPFEKALDELKNILIWEYSNSKGIPLTKEQTEGNTYSDFINLYIKFEVLNAPDQTERRTMRAQEKERKIKALEKEQAKLKAKAIHKKQNKSE